MIHVLKKNPRDSPSSYQDLNRIALPVSTTCSSGTYGRIFLIASKIGESQGSYQEYPACIYKLLGKQGEEFLIAMLGNSLQDFLSGIQ
jgi:hypothetical protein